MLCGIHTRIEAALAGRHLTLSRVTIVMNMAGLSRHSEYILKNMCTVHGEKEKENRSWVLNGVRYNIEKNAFYPHS